VIRTTPTDIIEVKRSENKVTLRQKREKELQRNINYTESNKLEQKEGKTPTDKKESNNKRIKRLTS
jgi:hypothetical protein